VKIIKKIQYVLGEIWWRDDFLTQPKDTQDILNEKKEVKFTELITNILVTTRICI